MPTTLSSSAEDLFKLYDGVETFVMFIGYPRSSHSLVAAILDAHPEIIIANEYHVLRTWEAKFRSSKEVERSFKKYQLFYDLHELFHYSSIHHFEKIKFGFIDGFHFQTFAEYWNSYLATLAKLLVVT